MNRVTECLYGVQCRSRGIGGWLNGCSAVAARSCPPSSALHKIKQRTPPPPKLQFSNYCFIINSITLLGAEFLNVFLDTSFGINWHKVIETVPNTRNLKTALNHINQRDLLTGGNWQKWKRVFVTCSFHKIYRDEAVGLKSCKYLKNYEICENGKFGAISWKFDILSITS